MSIAALAGLEDNSSSSRSRSKSMFATTSTTDAAFLERAEGLRRAEMMTAAFSNAPHALTPGGYLSSRFLSFSISISHSFSCMVVALFRYTLRSSTGFLPAPVNLQHSCASALSLAGQSGMEREGYKRVALFCLCLLSPSHSVICLLSPSHSVSISL